MSKKVRLMTAAAPVARRTDGRSWPLPSVVTGGEDPQLCGEQIDLQLVGRCACQLDLLIDDLRCHHRSLVQHRESR